MELNNTYINSVICGIDACRHIYDLQELSSMTDDMHRRVLLRVDDIMRETGASRSTVNRLMAAGTLVRVKIGRATRITADSYGAWIASLSSADNA